ncbi:unnamed protein product, partial [Mesorhabditis spiculigera]
MSRLLQLRHICRAPALSQAKPAAASVDRFTGVIPVDRIEKRFSRSSGPGGQHMQKSLTKCEIRFRIADADWIPSHLKEPLALRLANRINAGGEVVVDSDRTRERTMNVADCFDKLRATIYDVERELLKRDETDEDREVILKRQEKAAQKRLEEKRRLSDTRSSRSENFSM